MAASSTSVCITDDVQKNRTYGSRQAKLLWEVIQRSSACDVFVYLPQILIVKLMNPYVVYFWVAFVPQVENCS